MLYKIYNYKRGDLMTTNELRNARRSFRTQYSTNTFKVVELLSRGLSTAEVASRLGLTTRTVAAVKANLTRGTYGPLAEVVDGVVTGTCFRR
jgi:DNA-binding NarL/FixJ family response regulator